MMYAAFWSPDGTEFIAHRGPLRPRSSSAALLAVSLTSGAVREIANLPFGGVLTPAISPDGKWLAYTAIVAGADTAIFLQPWPALDRRWKVADRGTSPAWTRGGREIVFTLSAGVDSVGGLLQRMMAVEINEGPDPKPSSPRELFTARMNPSLPLRGYDVNKDGSRFYIMSRSQRQAPPGALNLMVNWFQELERLAAHQAGRQ